MKTINIIKIVTTTVGGLLGHFLGGFDAMLVTLITFITIDYITGVMNGILAKKLSSETGFKGIFKKIFILLMVGIATKLDLAIGIEGIRYIVISFYIANEGISILENATLIGLPVPKKIKEVLEQIKNKESD